jgi:hypothetical protein
MGDHPRLGATSEVRKIDDNTIKTILDLARPHNIIFVFEDLPENLRDPVQLRINELQQEKNTTPASNFSVRGGTSSLQSGPGQENVVQH